ncbi:MAG: Alginate export [uncultured Aureispira sp.]|uniref:Alginate export n=1 Tax=uncultured Aureispira sp. TaxID=1331704 RepID=A0A6S6UN81_9BACT|nr:MAG: Alginate export [uncultured Aureispira sp.]
MRLSFCCVIVCLWFFGSVAAQDAASFWIDGQIRPRMEFRNGYKTLQSDSATATAFIEQRSRLGLGYKNTLIELYLQAQDVRTWGSTPLVNNSNGFFTLFNAWLKIKASPFISIKVGRQVFSYDNQRILGGLNWAAQGRAHDAVLLEYKKDSSQVALQIGAAYNAISGSLNQQAYNLAGNYKMMQFLRFHKGFKHSKFSILVLNVGREAADQKLYFELSAGGIFQLKFKNFQASLEGYYQYGKTTANLNTNAYLFAAKFSYHLKPLKFVLGADFLSGTDALDQGVENHSFNPWMGTNHIFYGHLDYFYVGSSHKNAGLLDTYAQVHYKPTSKMKLNLMYHLFYTPNLLAQTGTSVPGGLLGHEIDFVFKYKIKKYLGIQLGYAHLLATPTLETLKPSGEASNLNHWAWLMLDVNLELFRHKIKPNLNNLTNTRF